MKVLIIEIVVYTKPTDEHQYLLCSSCHPSHTKIMSFSIQPCPENMTYMFIQ